MNILPIHERLAELWIIREGRDLTREEQADLEHCLAVNAKHMRQIADLHNLSFAASMAGDAAWQRDISLRREKLTGLPPRSSEL